jgi:hypothetical protein
MWQLIAENEITPAEPSARSKNMPTTLPLRISAGQVLSGAQRVPVVNASVSTPEPRVIRYWKVIDILVQYRYIGG